MGRAALTFAILLLVPTLTGCVFDESLEVALRVRSGQTLVIDSARFVDGTLLVEDGATLVLNHADLRIAQALVVNSLGKVSARDSTLRFDGTFSRQDIESSGTLAFEATSIEGLRDFEVRGGGVTLDNSTVDTSHLSVHAPVASHATTWKIAYPEAQEFQAAEDAVTVGESGDWSVENGTLTLQSLRDGILLRGGNVLLRNLTLNARIGGGTVISAGSGRFEANGVVFESSGDGRLVHSSGGTIRLIDSPVPSREDLAQSVTAGRIEVGWTLTARAVSPPGNIPVGGIDITLNSANDPAAIASQGTTDANGETELVALQYVFGGSNTRTGNPHALRAAGGGKMGAMTGIVVEGPATVMVPVFG